MSGSPELDERIAASAPDRHDLDLKRAEREIEHRLFGTSAPPMTLARYILLRELARGGGGIVFSAFDPELDRKVAIKLIRSGSGESAQASRLRLLREAQAMARLDHPNVIPVHDVGTYAPRDLRVDEGRRGDLPGHGVFVVMELADGIDLRRWLQAQHRSWREVVAVFREAAAGLVAAHRAALVHRDFKPSNVMIDGDGRVRVLDFGLARAVTPSNVSPSPARHEQEDGARGDTLSTPLTHHGVVVGTPAYMSPEQHRCGSVDERSDQYSFCAALYEGVYGRLPFPQHTLDELLQAKEAGAFARRPDAGVPRWLDRLLATGLARRPEDRHVSMAVLHAELGRDRSRTLRWGMVSLVVIAGSVAVLARGGTEDPCSGLARELDGIWDEPVRNAVEIAFLDTGVPYARQAAQTVSRDLDRYSKEWIDRRAHVCEAALAEGSAPMAETARAMLCLDRRLTRVGGLTQLFTTADAKLVEGAAAAVADLPPVETCDQRSTVGEAARSGVPREAVLAIEAEIARSAALTHAARYEEALRVAGQAVDMAERVGEPIVLGRALGEVAYVHSSRADYEKAEAAARRALEAAERGLDGELAVVCLARLAFVIGVGRSRYAEGLHLIDLAHAKAEGLGLDAAARRRLLFTRARVHEQGGQYREALADLEAALVLEESATVERPTVIADILNNTGVAYDRLGDYPKALAYYERALEVRRFLGDGHPDVGNALGNVGITLSSVGRYADAVKALEEALAVMQAALGPEHPSTAWIESNLGAVYMQLGRYEEAEARVRAAKEARERVLGPDDPITAMGLGSLAIVFAATGRAGEALELATREVEIAKQHASNRFRLAGARHNRGRALAALDRHAEAVTEYARSAELYAEATGPQHPLLVEVLSHRGESDLALGDPAKAIETLERALSIGAASDLPALELANSRFTLARAIAATEPQRAIALAEASLATLERDAPRRSECDTIRRWLQSQRK